MSPYKMGVVTTPTVQNYPGYAANHGWGMGTGGGGRMKGSMGGGRKMAHNPGGSSMSRRKHNSMSGGYR
jgi:hypothetical protein